MSIFCSWLDCQNFTSILAKCNDEIYYFCPYHSQSHLEQCSSTHSCESVLKNISFDKVKLTTKLQEFLNWAKDTKVKTINDYNQIMYNLITSFKKNLNSIKKIEKYCKNMIDNFARCGKIPTFFNNKTISSKVGYEDIKSEFKIIFGFIFSQCTEWSFNTLDQQKEIEKSFNLMFDLENTKEQNRYLNTFIENSKTFVNFDIYSFTYIKKDIDIPDYQGINFSICRLSLNEVFIHGGIW
ncbi:hypothetical protein SteCoe_5050 [Stentor coeruleus]|uniref:Uncharacterized protein n=1 Tax=Stentor coeruleus TaxID=5963 RepID=A0A1R2CTE9_9CILI|nr:hypothetical protein SteCoe_5050 [Stentor coeruleus]